MYSVAMDLLWSQLIRRVLVFAPPSKEARLRLNGLYNPLLESLETQHNISTAGGTWSTSMQIEPKAYILRRRTNGVN